MKLLRAAALMALVVSGTAMGAIEGVPARKPLRKVPTDQLVRPEFATGRLIVKFTDDSKVRLGAANQLVSRSNKDMRSAQAVISQFGLTITPAITLDENAASALLNRAAQNSRKGQPDILGLMYVTGPANLIDRAAKLLNDSADVEFVQFEPEYKTRFGGTGACCIPVGGATNCVDGITLDLCEGQGGLYQNDGVLCADIDCGILGACCVGEDECVTLSELQCTGLGGISWDEGINCIQDGIDCAENGCGSDLLPDCFTAHPEPACSDADCCTLVCTFKPLCCDEDVGEWDDECVFIAQTVCEGGDRCASGLAGSCFEEHPNPGCNNTACCNLVCGIDEFCCENNWDDLCVELAETVCEEIAQTGTTPDFHLGQGYLTAEPYELDGLGAIIPPFMEPVIFRGSDGFPLAGWAGEGYDLKGMEDFAKLIAEQADLNRAGQYSRGATIRVGIIEHSARLNHEELKGKVKKEPGQTILFGPGDLSGDHGTATLGIVGAIDDRNAGPNDERGIIGMAPLADMYFFPIVSAEEGGRLLNAIASAINTFEPGDILNFSIGPGGCGTLPSGAAEFMMIQLATDSGITCFISAGNSCCNLDAAGQFDDGDSGACIVGACTPGAPWCRLGFSNHCEECEATSAVHFSGWGTAVTTIGYGDLFFGNGSLNRTYTRTFGGTSAAAPITAGVAARIQGITKMFYDGYTLSPGQLRGLMSSPGDTSYNQCQNPDPDDLPGVVEQGNCLGDFDPDEEPNKIGPTVNALGSAIGIVMSGFFDGNPLIDRFVVIRGDQLSGTLFSVSAADGDSIVIKSVYTQRNFQPAFEGPLGQVKYLATGQITDLAVYAKSPVPVPAGMVVQTAGASQVQGVLFVEMYDWFANRWAFVDALSVNGPWTAVHDPTNPSRFVQPGTQQMIVRLWTFGIGAATPGFGSGGGIGFGNHGALPNPVIWNFDLVNVQAN